MKKVKKEQPNHQSSKDQLGDENIVVSGSKQNSKMSHR